MPSSARSFRTLAKALSVRVRTGASMGPSSVIYACHIPSFAYPRTGPRVLLLLPTETYRAKDFLGAAERLGVDVVVGSGAGARPWLTPWATGPSSYP